MEGGKGEEGRVGEGRGREGLSKKIEEEKDRGGWREEDMER